MNEKNRVYMASVLMAIVGLAGIGLSYFHYLFLYATTTGLFGIILLNLIEIREKMKKLDKQDES